MADKTIRPNTKRTYRNALTRVLQDEGFANTEVGEVTASDIRRFFNQLDANRENVRSLLAKIFNAAVDEGYITVSPLRQAKIRFPKRNGKLRPGDPRVLTADEVEALARAAGNDRDALAIRLGAYLGLRAGEVGGLRVEDVDVQGCVVHVRRNSQRDGMGLPKTATSERSLRVACSLTEDIARYVSEHEPLADGTILYTSQRNAMTDQPLTKMVVQACERAGMRRVTFHDLRHTCASLRRSRCGNVHRTRRQPLWQWRAKQPGRD